MKKIVLTMNQYDQKVTFDLLFVTGKKEMVYEHYQVPDTMYFFQDDLTPVVQDISQIIKDNKFDHAPIILNLNLNGLFIDKLDLPKLSYREELKAIDIELDKIYKDYKKKFVFDKKGYIINRQLKRMRVAFYNIENYKIILNFLKKLKHPLSQVVVAPCSIFQTVIKNKAVDINKPFCLVNVSSQSTIMIVAKKQLTGFYTFDCGIENEENNLKLFRIENARLQKIAPEIKRILYQLDNSGIENVYLNIEVRNDEHALHMLKDYLFLDVLPIEDKDNKIAPYLSSIGALDAPKGMSIKMPKRVHIKKEKKPKKPNKFFSFSLTKKK